MKKYYFVSYTGISKERNRVDGCLCVEAIDTGLMEISDEISKSQNLNGPAIITCLKDLTKKEYEMLTSN